MHSCHEIVTHTRHARRPWAKTKEREKKQKNHKKIKRKESF